MKYVEDISYMFYLCSSLKELPDISIWNTENICNLNSIFENCSLLTYIPDISNWKLNNKIKINNIFKGCNSLLIIPDISKWNIELPENLNSLSTNYNFIKEVKTYSLISKDITISSNSSKDTSSSICNNDIAFNENNNFINSKVETLDEYYENFYN